MNDNPAGMRRTTHNLASSLQDMSERLLARTQSMGLNIEYEAVCAGQVCDTLPAPPPTAVNDILQRALDAMITLDTTLDRINDSIGASEMLQKRQAINEASIASAPIQRAVNTLKQSARNY